MLAISSRRMSRAVERGAQLVRRVGGEVALGRQPLGPLLGAAGQGGVEPVDLLDAGAQRHRARVAGAEPLGALAEGGEEVGEAGRPAVGHQGGDRQGDGHRPRAPRR